MAGIGTIKLGLEDRSERILQGVKYILDLKKNLISLGVLDRDNFKSQGGILTVSRGQL